jgi:hypothetical protein
VKAFHPGRKYQSAFSSLHCEQIYRLTGKYFHALPGSAAPGIHILQSFSGTG